MASDRNKLVDFVGAYRKVHGHAPPPARRRQLETQVEAIMQSCGKGPEKVLAEFDLESEPGYDIVKNVKAGDTIIARAGRGVFQLTFTGLDDEGRLVAMAFNNGRYEFEHHIAEGEREKEKVWSGMLIDFRGFEVKVERLPLYGGEGQGAIACVRITAVTDLSLGPISFEGL